MIVSSLRNNGNRGAVYYFTGSGNSWTQQQKITASAGSISSGGSFTTDLNTLIVTGSNFTTVFKKLGGQYTEVQKIATTGMAEGKVMENGDYIYTIGRDYDTPGIDAGASFILEANPAYNGI